MNQQIEFATFGAGCFWCVEAIFSELDGVKRVVSGYCGGHTDYPTYEQVCRGTTGHAEVAHIEFDRSKISFRELLEVFWRTHDPTTLNQQGADRGTQYRSAIFYHSEEQRLIAEKSKNDIDALGVFADPVVTEIVPFETFFPAEDYHQNYFLDNPNQQYCSVVIDPKVRKFRKEFTAKLKKKTK